MYVWYDARCLWFLVKKQAQRQLPTANVKSTRIKQYVYHILRGTSISYVYQQLLHTYNTYSRAATRCSCVFPRCSSLARHVGAVARCNAAAHAGRVGAVHAKGWAVGFEIRPSCRMVLDTAYLGPLRYAGRVSGHKSIECSY